MYIFVAIYIWITIMRVRSFLVIVMICLKGKFDRCCYSLDVTREGDGFVYHSE